MTMAQKIKFLFTNNWISKVVSLFLAAVIWLTIFSYLEKNREIPVPGEKPQIPIPISDPIP